MRSGCSAAMAAMSGSGVGSGSGSGGGAWFWAANSGRAVSGAPAAPRGPPCFSSDANRDAARLTTGAGTPVSSATCTPQLRPAAPSGDLVQEDYGAFPFLHPHGVRPQSWQPVGELRKFVEMCGENGTAANGLVQGFQDGPGDGEAVERCGAAADFVDHDEGARAGLVQDGGGLGHFDHECGTAAREVVGGADAGEQPIYDADAGGFRRDRQAGLGEHDDEGVLAQERRFAGHVGAGEQQHAAVRGEVAVVGHEGGGAGQRGFDDGMAAGADLEVFVVGDDGAAPGAALGEFCGGLHDVEEGERVGAGGEGVGLCQGGADEMGEDGALASAQVARSSGLGDVRRSRSERSGWVKRAPLAMPWRRVSSGMSRRRSTAAAAASMT